MPATATRTARIEARISPETLHLVRRAAEIEGRSISDFVAESARRAAMESIESAHVMHVSLAAHDQIMAALNAPRTLSPGLERAFAAHKELVRDIG